MIQNHQEDPEVIKQESTEIVLRDIEVEPHTSPRRSNRRDLQYRELVELNSSLEIESGALKGTNKKNVDRISSPTKKEQEKKLECILVSIMKFQKNLWRLRKNCQWKELKTGLLIFLKLSSQVVLFPFQKQESNVSFSFYWSIQVRGFE